MVQTATENVTVMIWCVMVETVSWTCDCDEFVGDGLNCKPDM